MSELALPATFFHAPYRGKSLPGVYFRNADPDAPLVLVIGGADTSFEDLFLSVGRSLLDRGYSVAIADLPGQGINADSGLYWEAEAEHPIAAVIDELVASFDAKPGRIAMLGLSLGGYFVTRAASFEDRVSAIIASTPFPDPSEMFTRAVEAATKAGAESAADSATQRSRAITFWKAGARNVNDLIDLGRRMKADPAGVTRPFLSIVGDGDSPIFKAQARQWHEAIPSRDKSFVLLDKTTGADGHCQVNGRLRLVQEMDGWLSELSWR